MVGYPGTPLVQKLGIRAGMRLYIEGALEQDGLLWISWPKQPAKVETDVTEDVVRDVALAGGLVDVKVCAVDDTWSGLKLVRRLKDR